MRTGPNRWRQACRSDLPLRQEGRRSRRRCYSATATEKIETKIITQTARLFCFMLGNRGWGRAAHSASRDMLGDGFLSRTCAVSRGDLLEKAPDHHCTVSWSNGSGSWCGYAHIPAHSQLVWKVRAITGRPPDEAKFPSMRGRLGQSHGMHRSIYARLQQTASRRTPSVPAPYAAPRGCMKRRLWQPWPQQLAGLRWR